MKAERKAVANRIVIYAILCFVEGRDNNRTRECWSLDDLIDDVVSIFLKDVGRINEWINGRTRVSTTVQEHPTLRTIAQAIVNICGFNAISGFYVPFLNPLHHINPSFSTTGIVAVKMCAVFRLNGCRSRWHRRMLSQQWRCNGNIRDDFSYSVLLPPL